MPIDAQLFKAVVGSFPTGVAVVTAMGEDGAAKGLASNAVCSVSANPPLILVCLDKTSRSLAAFQWARSFVINYLAEDRTDIANRFASKDDDKFSGLAVSASPVAKGAPILSEDAIATAECVVTQTIDAGDHWIFIGQVESASSTGGKPLMYFRRQYGSWPEAAPAPGIK